MSLLAMFDDIRDVGRNPGTGGYRRFVWDDADQTLREWFAGEAARRGLDLQVDRNGNQWAWWGDPAAGDALVLGSHLDSVPEGGAYDGPLGVLSAFAALDAVRDQGLRPTRPVAVTNFVDEEGARFGIACAGSRLLTGSLDPDTARSLRDRDGQTMAEVLRAAGRDPETLGRDEDVLRCIGTFVELHVEQGRDLVHRGRAVGVGSQIWPHGRYRFDFTGEANHAGTTVMGDRRDPMLTYAATALAAHLTAAGEDGVGTDLRATFGRVEVTPNGTNAVPSQVRAWLDARAADEHALEALVDEVRRCAEEAAARDRTGVQMSAESVSPATGFTPDLVDRLAARLGGAPVVPTGAGHDAGVLALAGVPTAMLFVRNPTGVSHSPAEHAEADDCLAGVDALTACVLDLAGEPA
ncbi:MAG TPA: allantoate amidohydrolase [Nocardioidaceae bacterium]|nr:allantoate amidohydrolase [Nocardioidaceae bacterium]